MCMNTVDTFLKQNKKAVLLTLLIGGAVLLVVQAAGSRYIKDDTFITMRYARNFCRHGVPTWNVGSELVDGYTSPLHMVILAIIARLGGDMLTVYSIANILFGVAVLATAYALLRELAALDLLPGFLAVALLAAYRPLAFWITAQTEAVLFLMVFALATVLALKKLNGRGALALFPLSLLALALVRPEGFMLAVAMLALVPVLSRGESSARWNRRDYISAFVLFLLPYFIYFVWHWVYYGYPLPNTYYAKSSSSRLTEFVMGLDYLLAAILYWSCWLLPVALATSVRTASKDRGVLFVCVVLVLSVCIAVAEGGDVHQYGRFMLIPFYLGVFLLARHANRWALTVRNIALTGALALGFLFLQGIDTPTGYPPQTMVTGPRPVVYHSAFSYVVRGLGNIRRGSWPVTEATYDTVHKRASLALAEALPRSSTFAISDLGEFGYYTEFVIWDLNSLNDKECAHSVEQARATWGKFCLKELLARSPDYMIFGFPRISVESWSGFNKKILDIVPETLSAKYGVPGWTVPSCLRHGILENYRTVSLPFGSEGFVNLFQRRDLAPFPESGNASKQLRD